MPDIIDEVGREGSEGESKDGPEKLKLEVPVDVGRRRGIEGMGLAKWKGSSDMETGRRPPL